MSRQMQSGVVTRVVDGDTVWVKTSASQPVLKVRIHGIDAPEICQPGGLEALQVLKSKVMGNRVTVVSGAHDDYGRTVAGLQMEGQDIGRWLVANGHAWVYSYHRRRVLYADDMRRAQLARRGVFSDVAAEEPRLFRKRHGSCNQRP